MLKIWLHPSQETLLYYKKLASLLDILVLCLESKLFFQTCSRVIDFVTLPRTWFAEINLFILGAMGGGGEKMVVDVLIGGY